MKIIIITVAGLSSRFNSGLEENKKVLKAIYSDDNSNHTLLFHLLEKCNYIDKIIIVGGYKYIDLKKYVEENINFDIQKKITLIFNKHYKDLSSGYSLYLGLEEAFKSRPDEIVFVEGDIDIDNTSFQSVVNANSSVLTYTQDVIYANKSVILYKNDRGKYNYIFSNTHGLVKINEAFSVILNSGQFWKFRKMQALVEANKVFLEKAKDETNLKIIQEYIDRIEKNEIILLGLQRWINCNTRNDYKLIKYYWEKEK